MTTKCGEFIIPKEHLAPCHTCNSKGWDCKRQSKGGKGIDGYDFILYVTAINTKQCGDTIGRKFAWGVFDCAIYDIISYIFIKSGLYMTLSITP